MYSHEPSGLSAFKWVTKITVKNWLSKTFPAILLMTLLISLPDVKRKTIVVC